MKKTSVIGLLGTTLDQGLGAGRWNHWRPTVALCQHENLLIERFELLYAKRFRQLAAVVGKDMAGVSPETEVVLREIDIRDPWDFEEVYSALHDFALSYPFDPDEEDYLIHISTGSHVAQICLFLLTESRHFPARLIQAGPPQKKTGGPGSFNIIDLDLSRYDQIAMRFRQQGRDAVSFLKSGIETRNKAFNQLIARMEKVAAVSKAPILLTGPTGAGKSHLARRIYELKRSKRVLDGPFVEINCATIRGDAAMSALFGHKKGAFTGALTDRKGLLREADTGMLFLDEVGELGLDEQAMLLRAIEDKTFLPVGADVEARSDFQLICGTNRDLLADVRGGRFREDLLSRINLWTFLLPGLQDRREDIEPNLDYELDRFTAETGERVTFNREARQEFLRFGCSSDGLWRANFRDLNAAVVRMATLAPGGRISREVVDEEIGRLSLAWKAGGDGWEAEATALIGDVLGEEQVSELDRFDAVQLAEVIRVCRSSRNLSEAGRTLFAASRKRRKVVNDADRLRKYLAKFDLTWEKVFENQ